MASLLYINTHTQTNNQTTHVLELKQTHTIANNIYSPFTNTHPPQHTHTHTNTRTLEERPFKPEEPHMTSVQGHSTQTQTSMGAPGSQIVEEEECGQCPARDEERENQGGWAKINRESRRKSVNDV